MLSNRFNNLGLFYTSFNLFQFAFFSQAAGKYKQEGKNYVVNDGDIIFFKFNAGAGLTDKKKVKWNWKGEISPQMILAK